MNVEKYKRGLEIWGTKNWPKLKIEIYLFSCYNRIEVNNMNYKGFNEFSAPSTLPKEEDQVKDFFFSLSDEEQLKMLKDSSFYELFLERVSQHMESVQNVN